MHKPFFFSQFCSFSLSHPLLPGGYSGAAPAPIYHHNLSNRRYARLSDRLAAKLLLGPRWALSTRITHHVPASVREKEARRSSYLGLLRVSQEEESEDGGGSAHALNRLPVSPSRSGLLKEEKQFPLWLLPHFAAAPLSPIWPPGRYPVASRNASG